MTIPDVIQIVLDRMLIYTAKSGKLQEGRDYDGSIEAAAQARALEEVIADIYEARRVELEGKRAAG